MNCHIAHIINLVALAAASTCNSVAAEAPRTHCLDESVGSNGFIYQSFALRKHAITYANVPNRPRSSAGRCIWTTEDWAS